jgi:ABC-2 type transport system permease protein
MRLFLEFFNFELKFRFKSISTYVYFAIWCAFSFLCIASENFGPIAAGNGKVLLNGPYANIFNDVFASFFGLIIIGAIFGTSILRDFQRDTTQILFTKPITKFAYLGGRWAGSFLATVFGFSGLIFGELLGTLAPWADHARIAPTHLWWYVQPFLCIDLVQIFFIGSLFFMVAALTRRIFIVYVQGAAFLILYLIGFGAFTATRTTALFWPGVFDPIGAILNDSITRYWTVVEKNTLLYSWSLHSAGGVFFYNRILWISFGFLTLGLLWKFFPMSLEALTARTSSKRARIALEQDEELQPVRSRAVARIPVVQQFFGIGTSFAQYLSLTRMRVRNTVRDVPFWVLLVLMAGVALNNGHYAGRLEGVNVWPVTYLMLQAVEGGAMIFLYIVATFYAAELIWRERDTRFEGIHDALPMKESTDWLSKLTALCVVELALLTVAGLCGIIMQTVAGYYHYELLQYAKELYVVTFPQVLTFALFAMFVQTIVSNKFIGHGIVIGLFVMQPVLFNFGWENTLYLFGATPPYTYSDMNGYGHFVQPLLWSITYWLSIAAFLGVLSIGLARRGAEDSLRARLHLLRQNALGIAPAAALFVALAVGSGWWFYYNTHVLNEYLTNKDRRDIQADYEKNFKKYEHFPQPKIISVDAQIDIYPERRSFSGTGHFVLQNKTPQPVAQIHLTDAQQAATNVAFDRPFHIASASPRNLYVIYVLDKPLAPGETMNMTFNVGKESRGFMDGHERAELAYNGTFFDSGYFPIIGYSADNELGDPRRRREEHLAAQELLPKRGDSVGSVTNLFTPQSDWVHYRTTVSTSADQIAISPGYLTKDWIANGRHYFTYDMGDVETLDFFAFVSGKYEVTRDTFQGANGPITIDIYHLPSHNFDVQDMIDASKAGLAFYEKAFSPYQFKQYRILEYPRYRTFAQSFPNTVPFSEGIGFIERMEKPTDIDFTYFVTAHELGHQWWAHQLIGGRVAGSNMLSETLAEYSALMTMRHRYGDDHMHKFLKYELDRYLRGRGAEVRREEPLAQVQQEAYVWYQKGGQIMYGLSDYIGEDKVNLALHNFLMQYRYANSGTSQSGPYPDTRELVAALRAQTPDNLQYFIDDSFENIVLYSNRVESATVTQMPDHKYKVTLVVEAHKVKSDGSGNETPMKMNDLVDIGVFTGPRDNEKPLYLQKQWVHDGKQTFEVVVDKMPDRAGIDPLNKLIDRDADDNETDVTKQ